MNAATMQLPLPPRPTSPIRSYTSPSRSVRPVSPPRSVRPASPIPSPRPIYTAHSSSPSRGWHDVAPRPGPERRGLYADFGARCFGAPDVLKYPVCNRNGERDCRATAAAYARSNEYHHPEIAARVHQMAIDDNCSWAVSPTHSPRSSRPSSPRPMSPRNRQ